MVAVADGFDMRQLPRAIYPTRLAEDRMFLASPPSLFSTPANSPVKFMAQYENASQIFLGSSLKNTQKG
jgi:hypothetical protein